MWKRLQETWAWVQGYRDTGTGWAPSDNPRRMISQGPEKKDRDQALSMRPLMHNVSCKTDLDYLE